MWVFEKRSNGPGRVVVGGGQRLTIKGKGSLGRISFPKEPLTIDHEF